MNKRCSQILGSLAAASGRFPLVILAAILGFVAAVMCNHTTRPSDLIHYGTRLMLVAGILFPLGVAAGWMGEIRRDWRWMAQGMGLLLAVGVWFVLPMKMEESVHAYRYGAMLCAAIALVSVVPGTVGNARWWKMNIGIIQAIVLAGILSGIVTAGLQLAVLSVEKLFGVKLWSVPLDILSFTAFIVAPLSVIVLLPEGGKDLEEDRTEGFWAGLCQWVLVPLGFIFLGILAAYTALILVQQKLPDGMVAIPVLSLGAYGTAAMLLLQPWREERPWARWFARVYPIAFLIFSILLFVALAQRINAYGVTFGRYFALAFGIWFTLSALVFIRRQEKSSLLVTGLLALMALVSALGPMSAATISLRSQSARLRLLLENPQTDEEKGQIVSGLRFLANNFGLRAVEEVTEPLGLGAKKAPRWTIADLAIQKLGLAMNSLNVTFAWKKGGAIPTEGFRFIYPALQSSGMTCQLGNNEAGEPITVSSRDGALMVFLGNEKIRELLPSAMADLKGVVESEEPLRVPFTVGNREFSLVVLFARVETLERGRRILTTDFLVLEK